VSSTTAAPLYPIERLERMWPWLLRLVWLGLPFVVGAAFAEALTDRSNPVRVVGVVLAWAWWGAGLVATLVPHPVGLIALRSGSLVVVGGALWSLFERPTIDALGTSAVAAALLAVGMALWSETGHWCVNGPAYANERRFLLRAPAILLLGPIPVATCLLAAGPIVGPLVIAAQSWVLGVVLTLAGLAVAVIAARALYAQCRRFFVFVPAGFVVHDTGVVREPVLFTKKIVERLHAAPSDTDSLDLTANASGLAIEVLLTEKVEITKVKHARDPGETGRTARFLIVPTLPGRLLKTAAKRGFPV
jgi:hypothetical protein